MTFDDSYICYVIKNDVNESSFVLVYTNGTAFPSEIFLWYLYIKRGKNYVQLIFDDSYICSVKKIDVF